METYKYRFDQSVPAQDLEDTFMLALLAVESIYGHSRVRMESRFNLDKQNRTCFIDAATKVGCDRCQPWRANARAGSPQKA